MGIKHIERGTKLVIFEEVQKQPVSDEHEAVFRYYESDNLLVVQCTWLHDNYDKLSPGSELNVSFDTGAELHSFNAKASKKLSGKGLVMIEQLTVIESKSRRQFDRDEIRIVVSVYGMDQAALSSSSFTKPDIKPDLSDVSYDISSGGLCIISNTLLRSKHDPFYLIGFSFSDTDEFLLPAKNVRKSNHPRLNIGRYDYGFQFLFDNIPEEKARLSGAILKKKISQR